MLPAPLALPPAAVFAQVKRSGDSVSTVGVGLVIVSSTYSAITSRGVGLLTPDQETLQRSALCHMRSQQSLCWLTGILAWCSLQPCLQGRCSVCTTDIVPIKLWTQAVHFAHQVCVLAVMVFCKRMLAYSRPWFTQLEAAAGGNLRPAHHEILASVEDWLDSSLKTCVRGHLYFCIKVWERLCKSPWKRLGEGEYSQKPPQSTAGCHGLQSWRTAPVTLSFMTDVKHSRHTENYLSRAPHTKDNCIASAEGRCAPGRQDVLSSVGDCAGSAALL